MARIDVLRATKGMAQTKMGTEKTLWESVGDGRYLREDEELF